MNGVAQAEANRDDWSWYPAKAALIVLAKETFESGGSFEAFDLTDRFGIELDHAARWGALLNAAASQGLIVHAGVTSSRRPSRAGGLCRTWRGTEKAMAAPTAVPPERGRPAA